MLTVTPILFKYAIPAVFGAATKSYLDYQAKKVSICVLLTTFVMNSIVAVGVGSFSAYAFVGEFPDKIHFGYAIAFLGGAVGVNVLMALTSVDWKEAIQSRLNK
jgi:hypothetical protein